MIYPPVVRGWKCGSLKAGCGLAAHGLRLPNDSSSKNHYVGEKGGH